MSDIKEIKSIDLPSFTIIGTGIAVLFSILSSIIITVLVGIYSVESLGVILYIIPTIIIGTLIFSIYNNFFEGYLYNILAKRINPINFILKDEKEIVKVTTTETSIMVAIILTVQTILIYLVSIFILPLLLNGVIQTLMFSGQQTLAYSLYQFLLIINQPVTVAMVIFGTFIISFVFVLLGTYIYNIIANAGRGIILNLSKENDMTIVESVDMLKFAIAFAIVGGILSLILTLISLVSGGAEITTAIGNIVGGFIGSFIEGALIAVFYNFLAPKLGKLKIELIDL